MRTLLCLLLLPLLTLSQKNDGRQLVVVTISYEPDQTTSDRDYYLVADIPSAIKLNPNQTFLLQSAWHKEGDSIVNIGAGTVRTIHESYVELIATLYPGKKVQKGDMAMFLVPLVSPATDTLFFKMARNDINFTTVDDSLFYDRNALLKDPASYPTQKLFDALVKDIRHTGKAMSDIKNNQDMEITKGFYIGEKLFSLMQKINASDVSEFLRYVYARPDKYKAHTWKISETFATWVVSGAPTITK